MKNIRNAWYVAAWSKDLAVGKPFAITVLGQPIVFWRAPEGEVLALEDRCLHRMAPLSIGRCEGAQLRCMYHGILYDAQGVVVEIPGQTHIPPRARVRAFPVHERHGWIWVWVGDAARADAGLIPRVIDLDDPAFHLAAGQFDFDAEAKLVRDNLLDYSHLSFLHRDSFGLSEAWATTPPRVVELADGLQYQRWVLNQDLAPGSEEKVDVWSFFEFRVPGIVVMRNSAYPHGTAAAANGEAPDPALPAKNVTCTSQAITPMTDRTTRYFFSWGPHRTCGDESIRDMLMAIADRAFTEDRVVIQAQQAALEREPNPRLLSISSDVGVNLYNRLHDEGVRAEQGA